MNFSEFEKDTTAQKAVILLKGASKALNKVLELNVEDQVTIACSLGIVVGLYKLIFVNLSLEYEKLKIDTEFLIKETIKIYNFPFKIEQIYKKK